MSLPFSNLVLVTKLLVMQSTLIKKLQELRGKHQIQKA